MSYHTYIPPQILEHFGSDYKGETGDELIYDCPYCERIGKTKDTKGHLYVNTKTLLYFCHRCEAKGYLGDVDVKGYTFEDSPSDVEMMNKLGSLIGRVDSVKEYNIGISEPLDSSSMKGTIYEYKAIEYLNSRGFSQKVIDFYGMRVGNIFSKYRDRIIIPNQVHFSDKGDLMTDMFVARYFGSNKLDSNGNEIPKYLNPTGESKKNTVFNLHRIKKGDPIIITEGCFTAISAGRNAVATYGKQVSNEQIKKILANEPSMIIVALDPDAIDDAEKLCKRLYSKTGTMIRLVQLPMGEDANSLGHKEFMKYVSESVIYDPVTFRIRDLV